MDIDYLTANDGFGILASPDALLVSAIPSTLFMMVGDSHCAGAGDPNKADSAFQVSTANTGVLFNGRYASGSGVDPPSWTNFDSDLVMRSLAPHQSGTLIGAEIGLGTSLANAGFVPAIESIGGLGYELNANWKPTSTFMLASTGMNLFNTSIARMHSLEASLGRKCAGAAVFLGANDVVAGGAATANYGTNLTALIAGYRAAFGATFPIVVVRVSINEAIDATNLATVRAAQASVVAADAHAALVDGDDLPLNADVLHFNARANLTLGDRIAFAMRSLRGIPLPTFATPTLIGCGPADFGSGDLSPTSYAGVRDGDLELMVIQTGPTTGTTIATPSGWTLVGSATSSSGGLFEHYALFSRQVTTAMLAANNGHTAPTSYVHNDTENHAKIFAFRGPNLNPTIDSSLLFSGNGNATSMSITGVTTLTDNCGVFVFAGGWVGGTGRVQTLANSTLTSFTQIHTGLNLMPSTNGQVLTVGTGVKATAGATGTTIDTITSAGVVGFGITVALKP